MLPLIVTLTSDSIGDGKTSFSELSQLFEVGMVIGACVSGFIASAFLSKFRLKKKEKRSFFLHKINEGVSKTYEKLIFLRAKVNADRARICMFHNGGDFLDGSPIKKFTATHETAAEGVSLEGENLTNCVTSMFYELIENVRKNEPKVVTIKDLSEGNLKNFYTTKKVKKFAVLPIEKRDLVIGFVVVEWTRDISIPDGFARVFGNIRSQIEMELST